MAPRATSLLASSTARLPPSVTWLAPANLFLFGLLAATQSNFFTETNFAALLSSIGLTIAISLGQMVVIASGGMNLALGSIGALAGLTCCYLLAHFKVPLPVGLLGGLVAGGLAGWVNGAIVGRFRLSAFIVTLATASVYTGLVLGLTQAQPIGGLPQTFVNIGYQSLLGIPYIFLLAIAAAVVVAFVMSRTAFGRQVLAFGGNSDAAQLLGLRTKRTLGAAHLLSGLLGAWAGILAMAQLGQGQPAVGSDWLLSSFAAPIIGGTLFTGGYLSVAGTCLGAALLGLVSSGAVFLNISSSWVQFLQGAVVVAAAVLDRLRIRGTSLGGGRRRRSRERRMAEA